MHRYACLALLLIAGFPSSASAQWDLETSNTTADLRGIDSIGNGVAWASGTNGTVLRTEDSGYVWQSCAVPPGAEHLDFRGVQAFDANTAVVMSSGKGELSRFYKTSDGCHTWKLMFTNPDPDGFWDAIQLDSQGNGMLLGDPVGGFFAVFVTKDHGQTWTKQKPSGGKADPKLQGMFAASNSGLVMVGGLAHAYFVTGGMGGAYFLECHGELNAGSKPEKIDCVRRPEALPFGKRAESAGAFSLEFAQGNFVAVGGDYLKPNGATGSATYFARGDWHAARTLPHGYRSSVAYDAATKTWITVGPNGTDVSNDDGKNWRPLLPDPALHQPADADRNWNAISVPFVVGPKGRIGKLNAATLKPR